MTWAFAASAAVTVVSGAVAANQKNKAALANQQLGNQSEAAAWTQNLNDNKAIQDANLQNTIRAGYKAGILNMQRGQAKQLAVQSGLEVSKGAAILNGTATANSYAAGQFGASVDAVLTDITQKQGEAQQHVSDNYILQEQNFDTQLHDILTSGVDSIRSAKTLTVQATPDATQVGLGEVLVNAGVQIGGSYLNSQMSLGLGNTTGTGGLFSGGSGVGGRSVTPVVAGTTGGGLPTFDINH